MAIKFTVEGEASKAGAKREALDEFRLIDASLETAFTIAHLTTAHLLIPSQGTLSARLPVTLPRNAVVDALEVKVTAHRADEAAADEVAELRGTAADGANAHEIVVDFGTVRTVSAVRFLVPSRVRLVEAWTGTEFPRFTSNAPFIDATELVAGEIGNLRFARFRSDVRTERLRITVLSEEPVETLLANLRLILPDSPKDLAIAIDGGPPVWSVPGPAAKGPDSALATDAWNDRSERLADLTETFRALTGDPLDGAEETRELVLTSREAGVLELELHRAEFRRVRRARFGQATAQTLEPAAEGVTDLALAAPGTPAGAVAEEISATVSGAFGPERRIPATGPDPKLSPDGTAPLVELEITPERAAIIRLAPVEGLPALTGLRLALRAGPEGAEVRLQPWSNAGPRRSQPLDPLADLAGEPVVLEAPSGPGSAWRTHRFAGPVEIDPLNPPWVAVLVARGRVTAGLSEAGGGMIRIGPPAGPWRPLPALFGAPGFQALRFPYRAIGEAEDPADPAPVLLGVAGSDAPGRTLDPAKAGARITVGGLAVTGPALRVTHFGVGELRLADIDIVFDR